MHHLEERDVQAGIQQAWHGSTDVVPVVEFENAFPFEIERLPLLVANDTPLEGWSFFRCSDDGKPAGVPVFESYVALTNARFWEIVQNSVGGSGAIIESAGTIYDRCRRFVTVKLGTERRYQRWTNTLQTHVQNALQHICTQNLLYARCLKG